MRRPKSFLRWFVYSVGSIWLYWSVAVIIVGLLVLLAYAYVLAKMFL